MKTQALLDKYKKLIGGLIKTKSENIKFYVGTSGISEYCQDPIGALKLCKAIEIGELSEEKKLDMNNWCVGKYTVMNGKIMIASFELYQLPHCCAFLVSCKAYVNPQYRGKRVGTTLNNLRQDIGRALNYTTLMCTDIQTNVHQRQLLTTNGWKDIHEIKNKRTNNTVFLSVINL